MLEKLADKKLISIREGDSKNEFLEVVHKIRSKAKSKTMSLAQITKEVEEVRAKRYAKKKRQGHP
jgi:hypothetical protein